MKTRQYKLGMDFPREGFVQDAIERHFKALNFQAIEHTNVDYYGKHNFENEIWIIEAKGQTSDIGLDFRTGLGQIIKAIDDRNINYGLAMPYTPKFIKHATDIQDWVRKALNLHWLFVHESGDLTVYGPEVSSKTIVRITSACS